MTPLWHPHLTDVFPGNWGTWNLKQTVPPILGLAMESGTLTANRGHYNMGTWMREEHTIGRKSPHQSRPREQNRRVNKGIQKPDGPKQMYD